MFATAITSFFVGRRDRIRSFDRSRDRAAGTVNVENDAGDVLVIGRARDLRGNAAKAGAEPATLG
ncbi:hypothetical protein A1D31_39460 [Bradyrhizobium liaoningense]|nr:hypothetical protein A1D31_39460 [Bradyrhizobium liaoningense]